MEAVARHRLFRNLEIGTAQHGPCDLRRLSLWNVPLPQGPSPGLLHSLGPASQRHHLHPYFLPQPVLRSLAEVLRLLPPVAGPAQRPGHDPGGPRDPKPQPEPRLALDVHVEEPAGAGGGVEIRAGFQSADVCQLHKEPPSNTDPDGDAEAGGKGDTDVEGA